jgi:hypothetical protein
MGPFRNERLAPLIAGASVVVALTVAGPAIAQDSEPAPSVTSAEEAKRKGDDAMLALRYEEALAHYRTAYEASQNPAILYNMGRAYEGLADFPKALDALEAFAEKAPPELKAKVPKLNELLRDVQSRVATLVVSAPVADAEIRVGERVVGKTKAGQVILRVNAGKQKVIVSKEGYFPWERELSLVGGKVETVDAELATRAASALLRVTSPVLGAAVALDGRPVGTVPTDSLVSPGSHVLVLQRDGYETAQTNVVVAAGETRRVDVPMAKRAGLLSKWWFWTAVGVVAAGGVATAVALTTSTSPDVGTIPPGQVKAELRF